jgi:uncharacterized protein YdaU (DUF1376 family)
MPLYVADYRKDTGHLSNPEHGAYLLLIMHYWATGGLPDNDAQLARIACLTPREWGRMRATIQAFFHDGWRHKRVDEELAHAAVVSSKRKAAADQRHGNGDANASANAPPIAEQMQTQSPSPSHVEEKQVSNFRQVGEKKTTGWSPPRHGAQSQKHGTSYVLRSSEEWAACAEDYRGAHGGRDPIPDTNGGFWFQTRGYGPLPAPRRLVR